MVLRPVLRQERERNLLQTPDSRHLRQPARGGLAGVLAVSLAAAVVYAQNHLDEIVALAQWFTTDVVEPLTGIDKQLLGG